MPKDFRTLITENELRRVRTLSELRGWVAALAAEFNSSEPGREFFRLHSSKPMKVYREEVLPTLRLLEYLRARDGLPSDVQVRFPCDNAPLGADADLLIQANQGVLVGLQVAQAVDGQDERLGLELLTEKGMAPGFGPIERKKGWRHNGARHRCME